jgi:hypothetical protein
VKRLCRLITSNYRKEGEDISALLSGKPAEATAADTQNLLEAVAVPETTKSHLQ